MENLKELIKENYKNLPEDLQESVANPALINKLQEIAKAYRLNKGQIDVLKNETYFVLLGLANISEFENNLEENLEIEEERILDIADDVYEKVFQPVEITLLAIEEIVEESKKESGKERGVEENIGGTKEGVKTLDQINDYAKRSQPSSPTSTQTQPKQNSDQESPETVSGNPKPSSENLPEDLKEQINSPHTAQKIKLIAHKHGLDEKKQNLEDEIMDVLSGKESPQNLTANLEKSLGMAETQAESVVVDINEHIFKSVRDSLRKINSGDGSTPAPSEKPTSAQAPEQREEAPRKQEPQTKPEPKEEDQPEKVKLEEKIKAQERNAGDLTVSIPPTSPTKTTPIKKEEEMEEKTPEPKEKTSMVIEEEGSRPEEKLGQDPKPEPKEEKDPWEEIERLRREVAEIKKREIGESRNNEESPEKREPRDPWKEIEEKRSQDEQEKEGETEYHPGTMIDDKLNKRVKLPEHTK